MHGNLIRKEKVADSSVEEPKVAVIYLPKCPHYSKMAM